MSRILTIVGGVGVLALWIIVAMSIEFPFPDTSRGWAALPDGFLFGFMLIPKVFGQITVIGVSIFL